MLRISHSWLTILALCLICDPTAPVRAAEPTDLGRINAITVDGNSYTHTDVVTTAAGLQPGQPLSLERLRWALDNLGRRNLWAGYTILTRPGQEGGTTEVRLRVLERSPFPAFLPGTTALLPGYDGLTLRENNVLGGGAALTFRGRWLRPKVVRVDLTEPHLFGSPLFLELTGYYYKKDQLDGRLQFNPFVFYDERRVGGDIVIGGHFSPNDRLGINYHERREDTWVTLGTELQRHETVRSLNLFFVRDTRPAVFDARSGYVLRLGGEFHLSAGAAPPSYQRFNLDYAHYILMGPQYNLVARVFAGLGRGPVPFYDLWRLGGIGGDKDLYEFDNWGHFALFGSVLRAFQEGAFLGERAVNSSVEYRFPIFQADIQGEPLKIGGMVAIDAGSAWRTTQPWDWGLLRWSLAAGLRISLPLVTLRVDFGFHPDSQGLFLGTDQVF